MKTRYRVLTIVTCVCLLIFSTSCAQLSRVKPKKAGLLSERLNRIGDVLKADIDEGKIPGAVVLVVRKGKNLYFESFGMRDKVAGPDFSRGPGLEVHSGI